MGALREKDFRAVLEFLGDAYDADDRDGFRAAVLPGVRRLVPCDHSSYNELAGTRPVAAIAEPAVPRWALERWDRLAGENPLLLRFLETRDGRAFRFTDIRNEAEFRKGPLYNEFYRPLGIKHQIAFVLPSTAELTVAVALSRTNSDFSQRDRELLELVRPHLIQAYRAAQMRERLRGGLAAMRAVVEATEAAVVLVEESGAIVFASPAAHAVFASISDARLEEGALPPEPLARWIAGGESSGRLPRERGSPLLVRRQAAAEATAIVLAEPGPALPVGKLRELGLTKREAEVLHALAQGSPTPELAAKLAIAPRTLAKHVQNINAKLGVSSRAEAIAAAWVASVEPL